MTITPTAPGTVVLPAVTPDGAVALDGTASGDFLAMVQQALADALGGLPSSGSLTATPLLPEAEAETATPGTTTEAAEAAAVAGLVALATGIPQPLAPVVLVETDASSAGAASADLTVDPAVPGSPLEPAADDVPATRAGVPEPTVAPEPSGPPRGSGPDDLAPEAAGNRGSVPARVATAAPAGVPTDNAAGLSSTAPGQVAAVSVNPVGAGTGDLSSGPDAAHRVTSQVFPEVTGLVSRGNGSHRITLTLNPEALGEVHVVMTVRDGAVVVRLAAGQDAQRALVDGSPELSRLLELAGASETRIVVRDLGAGSSTGPGTGAGSSPGTGPDTGRSHDQHAGTRAHHPATDGTNDGTTRTFRSTTGAHPSQSIEPVTDTRTAGVDVTM